MAAKALMLGVGFRKIQPKLRMVANGSSQVNEVRADFSPAVQVAPAFTLTSIEPPGQMMAQIAFSAREVKKEPKRGKLKKLAGTRMPRNRKPFGRRSLIRFGTMRSTL